MKCLQPPKHEGVLLSNPPQYRCFRLGCQNTWVVGEEAPECSLTPHQKNDWREKFLKSPVMERLFAIELTAINTGRIEQWHGKTVQEELDTLLTQQAERIAEEVEGMKITSMTGLRLDLDEERYNQALDDVLTLIRTRNT